MKNSLIPKLPQTKNSTIFYKNESPNTKKNSIFRPKSLVMPYMSSNMSSPE